MGGVNSTRTITLVNDDKAGVIQLSEGLVHRLQDQFDKEKGSKGVEDNSPKEERPTPPLYQPPPPPPEEIKSMPCEECETNRIPQPTQPQPAPAVPWTGYSGDAHLMAAKLREEKNNDLRALDHEWRRRMHEREQEYTTMNNLQEEQLLASVKEIESFFMKVSHQPVCVDQHETVLSCYKVNGKYPLKCAQQVDAMARCANLSNLRAVQKT